MLFGKLTEVVDEYLRKGTQVYIEGQPRTRSWEDNGTTRYATEILVEATGTTQMLGRVVGAQTQPGEGQQFSGQSQPEPQAGADMKKGGAGTKGRGRKAMQPESQPQPPESDDYGFSDGTRSERPTVTVVPSCTGYHRRDEDERIFQNTSGAAWRSFYPRACRSCCRTVPECLCRG